MLAHISDDLVLPTRCSHPALQVSRHMCNGFRPSPSSLVLVLPATLVTAYDFLSQIVAYNDPDME